MDSHAAGAPSLPADRAFVVQFRADTGAVPRRGRAEHLVSGTAATFATWDELQRFVEGVLERPHRPGDGR